MLDAMDLYRVARALHVRGVPVLPRVLRKLTMYLHGSFVPYEAAIGAGTELGYGGLGVVIHPDASIGRSVFIGPHVVIGGRSQRSGAPRIDDDVLIGAGAKVLGPIHVGERSVIGANAVVVSDVAAGAVMVGAPARQLRVVDTPGRWWEFDGAGP
ncbi:MAG TPA: serine acetyltransferase [Myxococcales bacterium]|nr:serine acetyltransferase [Myxococcales bacterium]